MLILNNDNNVHDISLQPSNPSTDPTHDEGLDVHHSDRSIYAISIEN